MTQKNDIQLSKPIIKKSEHIVSIPPCKAMPGGGTFKFATEKEAQDFYSRMLHLSGILLNEEFFEKLKEFYESVRRKIIEECNMELQNFYKFIDEKFKIPIFDKRVFTSSGVSVPNVLIGPGVSVGPNVLIGSNTSAGAKGEQKGPETSEDDGPSFS